MNLFENIIMMPVAIVRDVFTVGGTLHGECKPYSVKQFEKIVGNDINRRKIIEEIEAIKKLCIKIQKEVKKERT